MEAINDVAIMTPQSLENARMKVASKDWLYETGTRDENGNFSNVLTTKDEKKVHKEEKKCNRNYTCRYKKATKFLVVEYYEFGVWN